MLDLLLLLVLAGTALTRYVGLLVKAVGWCLGGNSRRLAALLGYAGSVLELWIDLAPKSGIVRSALLLDRHTFGQWSEWAEDGTRPSHIG